jgi:hypothetical protein
MGYKRPNLTLVFGETHGDLAGLEVVMKRMSIDQLAEMSGLMDFAKSASGDDNALGPEARERLRQLCGMVADRMVEWNLEDDDDVPVLCTATELAKQDPTMVYAIITEWMDAVAGVSGPLGPKSPGGDLSMEESIQIQDGPSLSLAS